MAVQKSKKTSSKRGMRRSHDHLDLPKLSQDPTSGETHMRHHVSKNGFYRGNQVIIPKSDFIFQNDDQVILIVHKDIISVVENLFRLSSV